MWLMQWFNVIKNKICITEEVILSMNISNLISVLLIVRKCVSRDFFQIKGDHPPSLLELNTGG